MTQKQEPIEPRTIGGRRGFVMPTREGHEVFYTPVRPDDAPRLRRGIDEMSPMSRYFRFLSAVNQLSDEQVELLTHPDQVDHVAWGALDIARPGYPGIGLSRLIREGTSPSAEFAFAVIDAWQHHGVGRVLFAVLLLMAERRALREIHGWVAPSNQRVKHWLSRLGARWTPDPDAWLATITIPYQPTDTVTAQAMRALIDALDPHIT